MNGDRIDAIDVGACVGKLILVVLVVLVVAVAGIQLLACIVSVKESLRRRY